MLYQHFVGNAADSRERCASQSLESSIGAREKNKAAELRFDNKQAFHLATVYRVSYRRAADLNFRGDSRFGKLASEVQVIRDDQVP